MGSNAQKNADIVIDIKDLIATLIGKWKQILLVAVCAALLAAGFEMYTVQQGTEQLDYNAKVAELELTAVEAKTVTDYAEQYRILNANIENLSEYCERGAIMSLDPNNMAQIRVSYLIETDLSNFPTVFSTNLLGDEDFEEMRQILGLSEDTYDLQQLIRISASMIDGPTTDEGSMDTTAGSMLDTLLAAANDANYYGVLQVIVSGNTLEQAEQMSSLADRVVNNYVAELKERTDATLNLTQFSSSTTQEWNAYTANYQKSKETDLNTEIKARGDFTRNYVNNLTNAQKELYEHLVFSTDEPAQLKISKKIIVLGFIIGAAVMVLLYLVLYVVGDTVKTLEDAQHTSAVPVTGTIAGKKKLLGKDASENAGVVMAALRISGVMSAAHAEKAFVFVSDTDLKKNTQLLEALKTELGRKDLQMTFGDALSSTDSYAALTDSDAAFALVELKSTSRKAMTAFEGLCREVQVPLAGQVIVDRK